VRKCAELNTEMKRQWQIEAMYTSPVHIWNRIHSSRAAWCPQATGLTGFAIRDHTKICNLKYMQLRKFL